MNVTMKNSSTVIEKLHQSTHEEALDRNEVQERKWKAYSQENEELCSRRLKQDVLVPVGKKALFRGSLVHTNEILVSLGDGWFVKKSAAEAVDVCKRKMKECDEMLDRLKKERDLLASRKTFPMQNDVFGGRDEIIEPFNEEDENKWREKHKESLKRYRKELKAQRERQKEEEEEKKKKNNNNNNNNNNKDCNRDIFKILDSLECQEENYDELNRIIEDEDQARFVQKHVKEELNRRNGENNVDNYRTFGSNTDRHLLESTPSKSTQQNIDTNVLRSIENLNINERNLSSSGVVGNGDDFDYENEDEQEEEEDFDDDDDEEEEDDDDEIEFRDEIFPNLSSQETMKSVLKCSYEQAIGDYLKEANSLPRKKKKSVQFHSDSAKLNDDDGVGIEFRDKGVPNPSSLETMKYVWKCEGDYLKEANSLPRKTKKSVQFHSDKLNVVHIFHSDSNKTSYDNNGDVESLAPVIRFKHSDWVSSSNEVSTDSDQPIKSPSDLYKCFSNCRTVGKSILKASEESFADDSSVQLQWKSAVPTPAVQALGDLVEHESAPSSSQEPSRPVSRFKAARLAAKK